MKRSQVVTGGVVMALLAVVVGLTHAQGPEPTGGEDAAAGVGTAFTYQGRLTDGGADADGSYDFEFELHDHPSADSQVGSTVTKEDVTVTDGLFTVELDFGSGVFEGDARWLEIGVRAGDSSGAYTTLAPRQALTAAPYAVYALGADWSGLTGVPPGFADGVDDVGTAGAHDHWGETWNGSGVGLTLNSSDEDALRLSGGNDGLQIESAADDGVFVTSAGEDGVLVQSAGRDAFSAVDAGGDGLYVKEALDDGVDVRTAGDNGVYVESAGHYGVHAQGSDAGVYGESASVSGQGVHGVASYEGDWCPLPPLLPQSGGYFVAKGSCGIGAYGNGRTGVLGESTAGYGVHGKATTGRGVRGEATSGTGVYGSSEDGYAADFEGDTRIQGTAEVQGALTVDGPATGFFPRPAYDSGWRSFDAGYLTLDHNLGGSVTDYVVDLRCWDAPGTLGVHNTGVGYVWNDPGFLGGAEGYWGARWLKLYDDTVVVERGLQDELCDFVQLRIWVYE